MAGKKKDKPRKQNRNNETSLTIHITPTYTRLLEVKTRLTEMRKEIVGWDDVLNYLIDELKNTVKV